MKSQRFLLLLFVVTGLAVALRPAQTSQLDGAWRSTGSGGATTLFTMADGYLMQTVYEPHRYISTRGGTYQMTGNKLTIQLEFDTSDSSRVGQTETYPITLKNGQLTIDGAGEKQTFQRIDEKKTSLTGLWRITGRANDAGQVTAMQRGPRKTIKLLTGSRFQWVAINPQTKQFFGTGGGTYTLTNDNYTETIDFFSRDNSRVGKSLTFSAQINGDEWRHNGQSSTGGPVNEVWSREK